MKRLSAFLLLALSVAAQDWRYDLLPVSGQAPPPGNDGTIAYDPDAASVYMFGGQANSNLNDLWQYSLNTQSWRSLTPVGPLPPTRLGHTLVLDESKRRLILFGGQGSGFFSDVWAFDLKSESWAQLGIDNAGPSRRYGHSGVIDPGSNSLIISHGFTNSGRFDDTWSFNLATNRWTNITPSGTKPLRRCLHHAVLDPSTRLMYLYGGCASGNGPCPLNDLWAFDLRTNTWSEQPNSRSVAGRDHYGISFDSRRNRIVLFGGGGNATLGDTWFYDSSVRSWSPLPSS